MGRGRDYVKAVVEGVLEGLAGNQTADVRAERIIERVAFEHPVFTFDGLAAQKRGNDISGVNRTSYCGAYWGYGFHEDGVQSAIAATQPFGVSL